MLLTTDIGNTNIVAGLFNGEKLIKVVRFETNSKSEARNPKQILSTKFKTYFIEGVIISSVVPSMDKKIEKAVRELFGVRPYFVSSDTFKELMPIKLRNLKEIGADRLVNAYAAREKYGNPLIIIDFGTATTFCAVNKKGDYLGGAIAPGVSISRIALHEKTAKLPLVDIKFPKTVIGDNTVHSMQSGLFWGYIGIAEKMVELFKKQLGKNAKVIATGGLSGIIMSKTDIIDNIDPNLTLDGLRMIWEEIWERI